MKIYSLKQIETPRLLIRPLKLGDELEINQAINRSLENLQRWMPWAEDPSLETTRDFVYRNVNAWKCGQAEEFPLVAILKENNKIICATGFNDRSELTRPYFEIGYWIDTELQGRGLVTELVNALTRYALSELNATRVQIATQSDNIKSLAVAKRCGFVQEAQLKSYCIDCVSKKPADSYLFALYDIASLPRLEVKIEHHEKVDFEEADKQIKQKSDNPVSLPPLETDRLRLTPPTIKSSEEMMQALTGSLNEVGQWFTWASPKTTVEHVRQHMREGMEAAADINAHQYIFYLVRDKVNGTFLGEVWLKTNELPMVTINYWFDTRKTGQGYATEAVRELVRYAFVDLKVIRIQLHAAETNSKSIKLAKRLGFIHEGTMKGASRNFITNEVVASELFSLTKIEQLTHHEELISWAKETLGSKNIKDKLCFDTVVKTTWSIVIKVSSDNENYFLKKTPDDLFLEKDVINTLRNDCGVVDIPEIIAENKGLSCFLMKACGDISLRDYFDGNINVDVLVDGFKTYKLIQNATIGHIDKLIGVGVPDWRLEKFGGLYLQLVKNEEVLIEHGLTKGQRSNLLELYPDVVSLCEKLSKYNIPECLSHSDFHDNNMLIDLESKKVSIIDLGETAIEHPFFSLAACLKNSSVRYKLDEESASYAKIHQACFDGYNLSSSESKKAIELINQILPIYLVFTHMRLVNATCAYEIAKIPRMSDRVYKGLTWFLKNMGLVA